MDLEPGGGATICFACERATGHARVALKHARAEQLPEFTFSRTAGGQLLVAPLLAPPFALRLKPLS